MKRTAHIIFPCRFAYLNCWRPMQQHGGEAKYSVSAIISKEDTETIELIRKTLEYVTEHSVSKWGGRVPEKLRLPLHDGDVEKSSNPIFKNSYFINAKCKEPPQIVDGEVNPIINQSELYSGCYGNVSVTFYSYNVGGSRGIAAWLCNIQKTADGEPIGRKILAKDEFKPVSGEELLK